MRDDPALVPTFVLAGGSLEDRDAAIARLAEPIEGGHPIAVLRTGSGVLAGAGRSFGPHVVVKRSAIGCLCCTAGTLFRVALFGLLHATRPARLIVDLGQGAHVATLETELSGQALSRAVRVVERVELEPMKAA